MAQRLREVAPALYDSQYRSRRRFRQGSARKYRAEFQDHAVPPLHNPFRSRPSAGPGESIDLLQLLLDGSIVVVGGRPLFADLGMIDSAGWSRLMRETWLQPNRRAIAFGCVLPLLLIGVGCWMAFAPGTNAAASLRLVGIALSVIGLAIIGILAIQLRRPRVAFEDGAVLFYLRNGSPIAVPVEVVEAFFLGQGPAHLPAVTKQPQTVNLVARLSQRRTEWARQDVKRALGNWCDGYVTIRGSWCEPLNGELIRKLNRRLKEVKDSVEGTSTR